MSGLPGRADVTVLHLSDTQFGAHHEPGRTGLTAADRRRDSLFARLHKDLRFLREEHELRPDLLVVFGDLAEWAKPASSSRCAISRRIPLATNVNRRWDGGIVPSDSHIDTVLDLRVLWFGIGRPIFHSGQALRALL